MAYFLPVMMNRTLLLLGARAKSRAAFIVSKHGKVG
jgi:hypothetical protein